MLLFNLFVLLQTFLFRPTINAFVSSLVLNLQPCSYLSPHLSRSSTSAKNVD